VTPSSPEVARNFIKLQSVIVYAINESSVTLKVVACLEGAESLGIKSAIHPLHSNYAPLISSGPRYLKPDMYNGARPNGLHKPMRQALDKVILPSGKAADGASGAVLLLRRDGPQRPAGRCHVSDS
jgi:hypothetical protein